MTVIHLFRNNGTTLSYSRLRHRRAMTGDRLRIERRFIVDRFLVTMVDGFGVTANGNVKSRARGFEPLRCSDSENRRLSDHRGTTQVPAIRSCRPRSAAAIVHTTPAIIAPNTRPIASTDPGPGPI